MIERVTFINEENGFTVIKVKVKGYRDLVTVVGSLPSANAGEWVTAEGRWIQDREFGLQFRSSILTSTAPNTKEGIEKYLGSGMIKGFCQVATIEVLCKEVLRLVQERMAKQIKVDLQFTLTKARKGFSSHDE